MFPDCVKNLIDNLKTLPGVGSKSAERLAFSMIDFDKDKLSSFSNAILGVRDNITRCVVCGSVSEEDVCPICTNESRDRVTLLVVEKPKDIYIFEKLGVFNGVYHVLDGLISPLDGIGPKDINISKLLERISSDNIKEVILALKPSIEGETTMQYIKQLLNDSNVKVTKIATGVPMGTDMEFIDSLTLEMAIDERKNMN